MTTLAIPDPVHAKAFELRAFALAIRDIVADVQDLDRLSDLDAALVGAKHRLRQLGEDVAEAERTRVLVVQRIGQLLGPAAVGRPRNVPDANDSGNVPDANVSTSGPAPVEERKARNEARLLAAYPAVVDRVLSSSKASVRLAIRAIREERAEEQAVAAAEAMADATPGVDVQLGQWWALGEHRLYCGSSTDAAFVEACRSAEPTFVFADPPYNVGKADWDREFVWAHDYLAELAPVVAVTPGNGIALQRFLGGTGMRLKWMLSAWLTNGMTRGAVGFANWIPILLFAKDETSIHHDAQDLLRVTVDPTTTAETAHASRKPMRLLVKLLDVFTSGEDVVIDPFLGSGTTLIAADKSGRRCIGAEIDPIHCGGIVARYGKDARPL